MFTWKNWSNFGFLPGKCWGFKGTKDPSSLSLQQRCSTVSDGWSSDTMMVGQPAALLHIKIKRVSQNDICGHLWLTTRNSHFTKIGFHNGAKSEGRVRVTKTPFMYVCMYIYIICLVQVYRVSVQFILAGILLLAVCNHWPESRVEGRFSLSVVLTRSQHLPPVFTAQFSTVHVGIVLVWAQRKNREGKHLVCILRWTRLWFLFVELMGTLTLT